MDYLLSIIIPTYNRTTSLKELLLQLQKQTIAKKNQIILVDQNAKGFLEKEINISQFTNIDYLWLEHPNVAMARNIGAKNAKADCLLFLDDDLVPEITFCEEGLNMFKEYQFLECFVPVIKTGKNDSGNTDLIIRSAIKMITKDIYIISDTISAAIFIIKDTFFRSGGFDYLLFEYAKAAEDQEFFLRFKFKNIKLYYITSMSIFHDESQPGGCDLRNVEYWNFRKKCVKSWIFRYKIHRGGDLKLNISDYIRLIRSLFLNKAGFRAGFKNIKMQIQIFKRSLNETNEFLQPYIIKYSEPNKINHLLDF